MALNGELYAVYTIYKQSYLKTNKDVPILLTTPHVGGTFFQKCYELLSLSIFAFHRDFLFSFRFMNRYFSLEYKINGIFETKWFISHWPYVNSGNTEIVGPIHTHTHTHTLKHSNTHTYTQNENFDKTHIQLCVE